MNKAQLINIQFSPIYDSGSSLGREIPEERIHEILNNRNRIEKYIRNGKSEIRWEQGVKKINDIIYNIDSNIPYAFEETKLSLPCKRLISKSIEFRIEKLNEIIS